MHTVFLFNQSIHKGITSKRSKGQSRKDYHRILITAIHTSDTNLFIRGFEREVSLMFTNRGFHR
jgi:hypothetical protein